MPGSHLVHVCEITVFKSCLEPSWGTLGTGQVVFRSMAELCIISGCVMHVGAMSGHGNTWGHVRCLRRGPRAGAGVVSLVPVKVFRRGLGFASMSECVGLCRLCRGMLGHVVSFWGVSKHTELCLWVLPLLFSVLRPGLVPSPLPASCALSLILLCWAWRGNADSWLEASTPHQKSFSSPSTGPLIVFIHFSCHCTQGHAILWHSKTLAW